MYLVYILGSGVETVHPILVSNYPQLLKVFLYLLPLCHKMDGSLNFKSKNVHFRFTVHGWFAKKFNKFETHWQHAVLKECMIKILSLSIWQKMLYQKLNDIDYFCSLTFVFCFLYFLTFSHQMANLRLRFFLRLFINMWGKNK